LSIVLSITMFNASTYSDERLLEASRALADALH
jgi:hypothetical protein